MRQNRKIIASIVFITVVLSLCLIPWCFAVWDNNLPADTSVWNNAAGEIRANWDALEVKFGTDLDGAGTVINAITEGATGSATETDDTTAIAAAILAAAGKTIFFPQGTYWHTGLTVSSGTHIVLDEKAILKKMVGTSSADITITGSDTIIEGGTFNGNRANQTGALDDGIIRFNGADNCTVRNVTVTGGVSQGIHFTDCDDSTVTGCFVTDIDDYGIIFQAVSTDATGVVCTGNIIDKVAESTGATFGCIAVAAAVSGNTIERFIITSNDCYMPTSTTAVTNTIASSTYAVGGTISNNITVGGTIGVSAVGNDITVTGNSCYNGSTYGIEVYGSDMTITGNQINNGGLGKWGITIDGNDNVVSGNQIHNLLDSTTGIGILTKVGNTGTTINGNLVEQPNANGIGIFLQSSDFTVTGNTLYGHIKLNNNDTDNGTIVGNLIKGEGLFGIEIVAGADQTTINANTIEGATTAAIRLGGTVAIDYLNITNNNFTDSTLGVQWNMSGSGAVGDNSIVHNPPDDFYRAYTASTPTLDLWAPARLDGTSNTVTATLGSGKYPGQTLFIWAANVDNAVTVSVTLHETSDPEVFTFDTVGDSLLLMWDMTEWVTINNKGATT